MACRFIPRAHGGMAIICGPRVQPRIRRCRVCNIPETLAAMRLCDGPHPTSTLQGMTCDVVLCVEHAVHVEPNLDYCQRCAQAKGLTHAE